MDAFKAFAKVDIAAYTEEALEASKRDPAAAPEVAVDDRTAPPRPVLHKGKVCHERGGGKGGWRLAGVCGGGCGYVCLYTCLCACVCICAPACAHACACARMAGHAQATCAWLRGP